MPWNWWPNCHGMSGWIGVESVAELPWNRWLNCRGIGGRIGMEFVAALPWNTQREIVDVNQAAQMSPAQLSTQCVDNLLRLKHFAKAQHVTQVLGTKAPCMLGFQLKRQRSDDLFAVTGLLPLKHLGVYAPADATVEHGQGRIDRSGQSGPRSPIRMRKSPTKRRPAFTPGPSSNSARNAPLLCRGPVLPIYLDIKRFVSYCS